MAKRAFGLRRFGAAWAGLGLVLAIAGQAALHRIDLVVFRLAFGTAAREYADGSAFFRLVHEVLSYVTPTYSAALAVALFAVPLIVVARFIAKDRVRGGRPDPLDRARAWTAKRRWLAFVPAIAWTAVLSYGGWRRLQFLEGTPLARQLEAFLSLAPALAIAFFGALALTRFAVRALTAPTIPKEEADATSMTIGDDEITFAAVAVTPEAKAAVAAVAIAPQLVNVLVATLKFAPSLGVLVIAQIAVIVGAVAAFSRASRVAVGIDGVLVHGTSRRRFFAYRDLDEARQRGADLELVRAGKVVLRLQLHGADAARGNAVLERIRGHIARVAERRGHAEEHLVEAGTVDDIARAVSGAVDFRRPPLSRDALWAIVEGPTVDGAAREAAARALAKTADDGDHARLRVAAARCADPRVRVALERIDTGESEIPDDESATPPQRRALRAGS